MLGGVCPGCCPENALLDFAEYLPGGALGQDICLLVLGVDRKHAEDAVIALLANPVESHLDVLGARVFNRALG